MTRLPALLAACAVAAAVLAGCGDEDGEPTASDPGDSPTTSTSASSEPAGETTSAEPAPTRSGSDTPAVTAVPVYFVGTTPIGSRLYREFRNVSADDPLDEALALIGGGDALDPDYTTLLPGTGLAEMSHDEAALIEIPESYAARPDGMTNKQARLAIQQIVYTVQGVLQERIPVQFTSGGKDVDLFGVPFKAKDQGYQAGGFLSTLALCNVTTPAEGDTVSGTFTAEGVASSFEGTVPWEVRDSTGTAVLSGFAQAEGYVDQLYPWTADIDVSTLAPGTYTFVAMTDDPSGGEGGAGPTEDTKTITIA